MVRAGNYEGPIKKVLSGLRVVEKVERIPTVVEAEEWQKVRAAEKLRIRRMGVQVRGAPSSIFCEMLAKRATPSWGEAEALALAVLASTNLLRVSEEFTVQRKQQRVLENFGVKSTVGW